MWSHDIVHKKRGSVYIHKTACLFLLALLLFLPYIMSSPVQVYADAFCHEESELSGDMRLYLRGSVFGYGKTSQGMCVAGRYIIYTRFNSDYEQTTYVVIDAMTRREAGRYSFHTLHSNSLTYNPEKKEIVCVSKKHAYVFSFKDHRMRLLRDVVMNHNCCKIAYIPSLNTYFLGTSDTIYQSDDFCRLKKVFRVPQLAVNQGMGCDGERLYIVWYSAGHNVLAVYSPEGSYQGSYTLTSSVFLEVEEIDFSDEKMIVSIANSGDKNGLYTVSCRHDFAPWEISKAASCSKDGMESRACRLCGKTELKVLPATGIHKMGEWEVKREASCEKNGLKIKKCQICGRTIKKAAIPANGHNYTPWKLMEDSTVLSTGYRMHYCLTCGWAQKQDIPCLPATIKLNCESLSVHRNQSTDGIKVYLNSGDRIAGWYSDNPDIASVDESGAVTGHAYGKTRITVKTAGNARKSIQVKVGFFPVFATRLSIRAEGLKKSSLILIFVAALSAKRFVLR